MATETLELVVRTSGASAAGSELSQVGTAASSAATSINAVSDTLRLMRNVLVGISFLKAFEGLSEGISQMQQLNNLLTTITDTVEQQTAAFQRLVEASNEVRAGVEPFTQFFTNLTRSTAGYKLSAEDAIKTTQSFFATFAISGLDPQQIKNVTRDMKEVFNVGTVQGRIFRSVVMQDQEAALVLSKYIVATGTNAATVNKQLDEIRAKGQQPDIQGGIVSGQFRGAFTGGDIQRAFLAAQGEEMEKMRKTSVTLSQAFTILSNDWLLFLNNINTGSPVFGEISKAIMYVGENLQGLIEILLTVAAIWLTRVLVLPIAIWLAQISAQTVIASAQFIVFGAQAAAAGAAAVAAFTLQLPAILDSIIASVVAATVAFGTFIAGTVLGFPAMAAGVLLALPGLLAILAVFTTLAALIGGATAALLGFLEPLLQLGALGDPFKDVTITIKDLPKVFAGVMDTVVDNWSDIMKTFSAMWSDMINGLQNKWNKYWNDLRNDFRTSPFGLFNSALPAPAELPTNTASPLVEGLKNQLQGNVAGQLNGGFAKLVNGSYQTGSEGFQTPLVTTAKPGAPADEAKKSSANALAALDALIAKYEPAAAAAARYAQTQKVVANAEKAGIDVKAELGKWSLNIEELHKREALAAAGVGNAETDYAGKIRELNEIESKYNLTQQQSILLSRAKTEARIKELGTHLDIGSGVQTAELKQQLSVTNENPVAAAAVSKAYANTNAVNDYRIAQIALKQAVADGQVSQLDATKTLEAYRLTALNTKDDIQSGIDVAMQKYNETLRNQNVIAQSVTKTALSQVEANNTYAVSLDTLNKLQADGVISNERYVQSVQDIELALLKTKTDALSGFQAGMITVQKDLADSSKDASKVVTDAFGQMTTALTDFFMTGKLNLHSFVTDILKDLDTLAVKQAIMKPLADALGFGSSPGQGIGSSSGSPLTGFLSTIMGGGAPGSNLGATAANPVWTQSADLAAGGALSGITGGGGSSSGGGGFLSGLFGGGGSSSGGDSTGGIGGFFSKIGGFLGFASGADFMVGGSGAADSQLVAFRASPDERVQVKTPQQVRDEQRTNGASINLGGLHLHGVTDADSFQRSRGQAMAGIDRMITRAATRNAITRKA